MGLWGREGGSGAGCGAGGAVSGDREWGWRTPKQHFWPPNPELKESVRPQILPFLSPNPELPSPLRPRPPIFCPSPPFFAPAPHFLPSIPPQTPPHPWLWSHVEIPHRQQTPNPLFFAPKPPQRPLPPPPSPTLGGLCVGLWGTAGFCPTDRPLPARGAAQVLLCSGYGVRGEETGAALLPLPAPGLCPDPIPSPIPIPGVVPSPCIVPIPNLSASLIPNPVFLPPFPAHLLISAPFFPHSQSRSYSRSISQR